MNRQIKFRGRTLPDTWFYGNLVQIDDDCRIQFKDSITDADSGKTMEFYRSVSVDPSIIGQFTGLLDRNGKEIYEGDVVKISTALEYAAKEAQDNIAGDMGIKPPEWTYGGDEIARVSYFDGAFHYIILESFMPDGIGRQEPMLRYLFRERYPDEPQNYRIEIEVIGNIHDNPELMGNNQSKS